MSAWLICASRWARARHDDRRVFDGVVVVRCWMLASCVWTCVCLPTWLPSACWRRKTDFTCWRVSWHCWWPMIVKNTTTCQSCCASVDIAVMTTPDLYHASSGRQSSLSSLYSQLPLTWGRSVVVVNCRKSRGISLETWLLVWLDCWCIWQLKPIVTNSDIIWKIFCYMVTDRSQWKEWADDYLSQNFVVNVQGISHLLIMENSRNVIVYNEWEPCSLFYCVLTL